MENSKVLMSLAAGAPNRRKFVQLVSAASAALGAAGTANAQTIQDTDILQFALNLEYLEAEFYTYATTGMTIAQMGVPTGGSGNPGPTTDGYVTAFSGGAPYFTREVALELADDERKHVIYIRNVLQNNFGTTPIAKPAISLSGGGTFPFSTETGFLQLSRLFEDVGVTAYAGAAPLISSPGLLGNAARILATESYHAAAIRMQIAERNIPTGAADGVDIIPPPSGTRYYSDTPDTGQVQVRTPGQVLYLVYGFKANATSGGFFPSGVNGIINTSTGPA